jgi:cytochrome P450
MEAYPSVQTQLRKALNNAFPGNKVPSAEEITHSDIPYLDAAIEEGFRLAGVAKASLRQALVDTSILGCPIPKGAEIIMNYHINRQPVPVDESKRSETCRANVVKTGDGLQGRAGFDLGKFNPGRYITKDTDSGEEKFNQHALPSIAFGGGYRGCVGKFSFRGCTLSHLRFIKGVR